MHFGCKVSYSFFLRFVTLIMCLLVAACASNEDGSGGSVTTGGVTTSSTATGGSGPASGKVHVVVFTHIEDNTPAGAIGTPVARQQYQALRDKLVELASRAKSRAVPWVLQPDWKYLVAAQTYEDAAMTATTDGKNVFRYLKEDLGVSIDPHAHENKGYNYTDVAHLLELLGVGGSPVIGGHIWDPSLPEFQHWERFRVPVAGKKFPSASWRGEILIGSGTPNHVNDPLVSGAWRPQDPEHYFVDAPGANILAFGAWHDGVVGVVELVNLYKSGAVQPSELLTASWNLRPDELTASNGIDTIDTTVLQPLAEMQAAGTVVVTDFTTLAATFASTYDGTAFVYQP